MSDEDDMPSHYRLEQLVLDEAPRAVVERLGARLSQGDVRERIAELQADDAAIRSAHPPARALAIVRARAGAAKAERPRAITWWVLGPVLAGATAAIVVTAMRSPDDVSTLDEPDDVIARAHGVRVVPDELPLPAVVPAGEGPQDTVTDVQPPVHVRKNPGPDAPDFRIKGPPHLLIHRRVADRIVRLADEDVVHADDLLQVGYVASDDSYGVIVSIDGSGVVTLHFPDEEQASSKLERGEAVALAHSYELDDAPDFERFFFVSADAPIDPADVVDAAERLAASPKRARTSRLRLPQRVHQNTLLLKKAAP